MRAPPSLTDALVSLDYAEIEENAELAANLWNSISLAAHRSDAITVGVHLRQVRLITFAVLQSVERCLAAFEKQREEIS